jgi:hypothetical protein
MLVGADFLKKEKNGQFHEICPKETLLYFNPDFAVE